LSSLLGCGPEQSAADRDSAQLKAQIAADTAALQPFVGKYAGTITYDSGLSYQVVMNLGPNVDEPTNSGTLTHTVVPTIKGTFAQCLGDGCANPAIGKILSDSSIQIVSAYLNAGGELVLSTTQNTTNCSVGNAVLCSPFTISLNWNANHDGLTGTMGNSAVYPAQINVKRLQ